MIFMTLGTQKFQLNRLLQTVDEILSQGLVEEEVFAQTGYSTYRPLHYQFQQFLGKQEFDNHIRQARLVITHSGVGTIMSVLQAHRPVIVFPRLAKYKEHVDNHQLEIAKAFAVQGHVLCCQEHDDLLVLMKQSETYPFVPYTSQTEQVVTVIRGFLESH